MQDNAGAGEGAKAEDLIKLLEEKNEAHTKEMLEYWREQLKSPSK